MIKRHRKKIAFSFLIACSFISGFLVHAFFFPFVLTDNVSLILQGKAQDTTAKSTATGGQNLAVTKVLYVDGEFTPKVVQIRNSYYLSIINTSKNHLMFLASENPLLRTQRGYGESEELRAQLYDKGVYEVFDRNNPSSRLKVIVQ